MTRKQTRPGEQDPSRFAVDAAGIKPMHLVKTIEGRTEEQNLEIGVA